MRSLNVLLCCGLFFAAIETVTPVLAAEPQSPQSPVQVELLSVKKIWNKAPHNAFTDLVRFKDKWFLTFRESSGHVATPLAGNIRVISSKDGETWESAALLEPDNDDGPADLRDPKISVTPEGRLLLVCGKLFNKDDKRAFQSYAYLSDDGTTWEGPHKIGDSDWWMWRVVWHPDGTAYGISYDCNNAGTRLYRSKDGINFETILPKLTPDYKTNEEGLLFRKDGSAVALFRTESNIAYIGTSKGDYRKWNFHELKKFVGGPQIIETPDGHILTAARTYKGKDAHTVIAYVDPEAGKFIELLTLPSGIDTSYPGMVLQDGVLWVSYYSSHAGKADIYLAKMKVVPTSADAK